MTEDGFQVYTPTHKYVEGQGYVKTANAETKLCFVVDGEVFFESAIRSFILEGLKRHKSEGGMKSC